MSDHHECGRSFGTEPKEWFVKEIAGVLLTMELERLVAVLGLAYKLPYVPNDGARQERDLLHLTLVDNVFCFGTNMMSKNGGFNSVLCSLLILTIVEYNTHTGPSYKGTPKRKTKHDIFAPASPALSGRISSSTTSRKASLRASDTGMKF